MEFSNKSLLCHPGACIGTLGTDLSSGSPIELRPAIGDGRISDDIGVETLIGNYNTLTFRKGYNNNTERVLTVAIEHISASPTLGTLQVRAGYGGGRL